MLFQNLTKESTLAKNVLLLKNRDVALSGKAHHAVSQNCVTILNQIELRLYNLSI